jgi:hypothetical protein
MPRYFIRRTIIAWHKESKNLQENELEHIKLSKTSCFLGEPLRGVPPLASGYPLHHLQGRPAHQRCALGLPLRWFRYYPSRWRTVAPWCD